MEKKIFNWKRTSRQRAENEPTLNRSNRLEHTDWVELGLSRATAEPQKIPHKHTRAWKSYVYMWNSPRTRNAGMLSGWWASFEMGGFSIQARRKLAFQLMEERQYATVRNLVQKVLRIPTNDYIHSCIGKCISITSMLGKWGAWGAIGNEVPHTVAFHGERNSMLLSQTLCRHLFCTCPGNLAKHWNCIEIVFIRKCITCISRCELYWLRWNFVERIMMTIIRTYTNCVGVIETIRRKNVIDFILAHII